MAARRSPKTAVVAFKVEAELANLLNKLPNKSAFIRKAIVAQLDLACPVCRGTGLLPKGLHDHYAPLIQKMSIRACESCGENASIHVEGDEISDEDRARLGQFFHGGPFYCDSCYHKAPPCGECGWHITAKEAKWHHRVSHDRITS